MAKLGIHAFAAAPVWRPDLWADILPRLTGLGVSLVEIPLLRPEELDAPATRRLAEAHGVELVCSLGLPDRLDVVARPDEALAFMRGALDATAACGATALSGVTFGTIGRTTGAAPTAREIDGTTAFVARAAAEAKARGLRFGIEPCNRYETHLLNTAAQARAMIERTGADNVFIHLDTYHMQIEEQSLPRGFAEAGDLLGYVHLSESNRGVPGRGTVDWAAAFAGMVAIGYDGPMALESFVHVDADLAGGLAIWRPVAGDPDWPVALGLPFLRAAGAVAGVRWQ
jgi:D-psicose/D-tagatose/L-ribulose 3-epimerase